MFVAIGLIVALACLAVFLLLAMFKTSVGPFLGLVWADIWGLTAARHFIPTLSYKWLGWTIIPWYLHVVAIAFALYAVYTLYELIRDVNLEEHGTSMVLIRTAFTWPAILGLVLVIFG